jgi:hypothetical protein
LTFKRLYATKRGEWPRSLAVWSVCHGESELLISRSSDSSKAQWSLGGPAFSDVQVLAVEERSGSREAAEASSLAGQPELALTIEARPAWPTPPVNRHAIRRADLR